MTEIDNILTTVERQKFASMARYWYEVEEREDTSPLMDETLIIYRQLGVRTLFILARYIELTEEKD